MNRLSDLMLLYYVNYSIGILTKQAKHHEKTTMPFSAQHNIVVKITVNVHLTFSFFVGLASLFRVFPLLACLHQHHGPWLQKSLCSHQITCVVISCSIQQTIICFRYEPFSILLLLYYVCFCCRNSVSLARFRLSCFSSSAALASFWSVDRYSV